MRFLLIMGMVFLVLLTAVSAESEQVAFDGFESGTFCGGSGWSDSCWTTSGSTAIRGWTNPYEGNRHVWLRSNDGVLSRTVDISGMSNINVSFANRVNSFEGGDSAVLDVSIDGGAFTTLHTWTENNNVWHLESYPIASTGSSMVVRFRSLASDLGDEIHFDNIQVNGEIVPQQEVTLSMDDNYVQGSDALVTLSSTETDTLHTLELSYPNGTVFCQKNAESPSVAKESFSVSCELPDEPVTDAKAYLYESNDESINTTKYFNIVSLDNVPDELKITNVYYSPQVIQGSSTEIFAVVDSTENISDAYIIITYSDGQKRKLTMSPTINEDEYRAFITDTYRTGFQNFTIHFESSQYYDTFSSQYYVAPYKIDYVDKVGKLAEPTIEVHGTQYDAAENGKLFIQLLDENNNPLNDSICYMSLWYPMGEETVFHNQLMSYLDEGLYYYNFQTPYRNGIYPASSYCIVNATDIQQNFTSDDFETGTISGGTGWSSDWVLNGASIDTGDSYQGDYSLEVDGDGDAPNRDVETCDSSDDVTVSFYWWADSLESEGQEGPGGPPGGPGGPPGGPRDDDIFRIYIDDGSGSSFLVKEITNANDDNVWRQVSKTFNVDDDGFDFSSDMTFRATSSGGEADDYVRVDNIEITTSCATSGNISEYQLVRGSGEVHVQSDMLYTSEMTRGELYNETFFDGFYFYYDIQSRTAVNVSGDLIETKTYEGFPCKYINYVQEYNETDGMWYNISDLSYNERDGGRCQVTFPLDLEPDKTHKVRVQADNYWKQGVLTDYQNNVLLKDFMDIACINYKEANNLTDYDVPLEEVPPRLDNFHSSCWAFYNSFYEYNKTFSESFLSLLYIEKNFTVREMNNYEANLLHLREVSENTIKQATSLIEGLSMSNAYSQSLLADPFPPDNPDYAKYFSNISSSYLNYKKILNLTSQVEDQTTTFIGGTEYESGEDGKIAIRLLKNNGGVETGATCTANILYPNETAFVTSQAMSEHGDGVYTYNFTVPETEGVYTYYTDCSKGGKDYRGLATFHVAPWANYLYTISGGSFNDSEIISYLQDINDTVTTIDGRTIEIGNNITALDEKVVTMNGTLTSVYDLLVEMNTTLTNVYNLADSINATVVSIQGTVSNIETIVLNINGTVVEIDQTTISINNTVNTIDTRTQEIQETVNFINNTVNAIDDTTVDIYDGIVTINGTVNGIENTVVTINDTVNNIEVDLQDMNGTLYDIISRLEGINTTVEFNKNLLELINLTVDDNQDLLNLINTSVNENTNLLEVINITTTQNNELLESINLTVNQIEEDIFYLNGSINTIDGKVDQVLANQIQINGTVNGIENTVLTINTTTQEIQDLQVLMNGTLTDVENTTIRIEEKVDGIVNDLVVLNGTINGIENVVLQINGTVTTVESKVDDVYALEQYINSTTTDTWNLLQQMNITQNDMYSLIQLINQSQANNTQDIQQILALTQDMNVTLTDVYALTLATNTTVNDIYSYVQDINTTVNEIYGQNEDINMTVGDIYSLLQLVNQSQENNTQDIQQILALTQDTNDTMTDIYALALATNSTVNSIYALNQQMNLTLNDIYALNVVMNTSINDLQTSISDMNLTLNDIDDATARIENDLFIINGTVNDIEGVVITINGTVNTIETKVDSIQQDILYINNSINTIQSSLVDINGTIITMDGKIDSIQSAVITINGTVNNIENVVLDINGTVTDIESDVGVIDGKIDSITDAVITINSTLNNVNQTNNQIYDAVLTINGTVNGIENTILIIDGKVTTIQGLAVDINETVYRIEDYILEMNGTITDIEDNTLSINSTVNDIRSLVQEINGTTHDNYELLLQVNGSLNDLGMDIDDLNQTLQDIYNLELTINDTVYNMYNLTQNMNITINNIEQIVNDTYNLTITINGTVNSYLSEFELIQELINNQTEWLEIALANVSYFNASEYNASDYYVNATVVSEEIHEEQDAVFRITTLQEPVEGNYYRLNYYISQDGVVEEQVVEQVGGNDTITFPVSIEELGPISGKEEFDVHLRVEMLNGEGLWQSFPLEYVDSFKVRELTKRNTEPSGFLSVTGAVTGVAQEPWFQETFYEFEYSQDELDNGTIIGKSLKLSNGGIIFLLFLILLIVTIIVFERRKKKKGKKNGNN